MLHTIVVLIYWLVLHKEAMREFSEHKPRLVYQHTVHSMPACAYIMNFMMTNVTLQPNHAFIVVFPISVLYMTLNCMLTWYYYDRGNPYFFLGQWDSLESPVKAMGLVIIASCLYYAIAKILQRVKENNKGSMLQKTEKANK